MVRSTRRRSTPPLELYTSVSYGSTERVSARRSTVSDAGASWTGTRIATTGSAQGWPPFGRRSVRAGQECPAVRDASRSMKEVLAAIQVPTIAAWLHRRVHAEERRGERRGRRVDRGGRGLGTAVCRPGAGCDRSGVESMGQLAFASLGGAEGASSSLLRAGSDAGVSGLIRWVPVVAQLKRPMRQISTMKRSGVTFQISCHSRVTFQVWCHSGQHWMRAQDQ